MAQDKPIYDLTLLMDSKVDDDGRGKIVADIEDLIAKHGEIIDRRDWGIRPTTFRLNHMTEADYRLIQFNGPNALLDQLDHNLKITDGVIRFRIIKIKAGTPIPDLNRELVASIPDEDETDS